MLVKGVCEAAAAFSHVSPGVALRQVDLVRAAISAQGDLRPLRGPMPNIEELERSVVVAPRTGPPRSATG